jgi:hypothetical protein
LLKIVPDLDGPVFKKVIYDPTIDGPNDAPPVRPFWHVLNQGLELHERWFTKRTTFQAQGEVRLGWLTDPIASAKPIPLTVAGLQEFVKVLA